MTATRTRLTVPLVLAAVFVGGLVGGGVTTAALRDAPAAAVTVPCDEPTSTPTATPAAWVSPMLATAQLTGDVRVTGSIPAPQVIMTTAPVSFDGGPVRIELTAEYVNMIVDPTSALNGIGFEIYVDGVKTERLGIFGSHSQISMFAPLSLSAVLTDARAIPAGTHTIGIGVWKWSAGGDGYLKAGAGVVPIQLVVSRA